LRGRRFVSCSFLFFFFSSRRRHTRSDRDWSSDVCSSDLASCRTDGMLAHALTLGERLAEEVEAASLGPRAGAPGPALHEARVAAALRKLGADPRRQLRGVWERVGGHERIIEGADQERRPVNPAK